MFCILRSIVSLADDACQVVLCRYARVFEMGISGCGGIGYKVLSAPAFLRENKKPV